MRREGCHRPSQALPLTPGVPIRLLGIWHLHNYCPTPGAFDDVVLKKYILKGSYKSDSEVGT